MSRIHDVISEFLRQSFEVDDWEMDDEGDHTVAFRLEDADGNEWAAEVLVEEQEERVVFYSTFLEPTAPEHRREVMELVTRANFGLPIGNFEFDLDDGEVCFKTTLDLEGVEITAEMCKNLVATNLLVMGTYFDAFNEVMEGKTSAVAAIAEVEEAEEDEDDEDGDDDGEEDEDDDDAGDDEDDE